MRHTKCYVRLPVKLLSVKFVGLKLTLSHFILFINLIVYVFVDGG